MRGSVAAKKKTRGTNRPGTSGGIFTEAKRKTYLDVLRETGEAALARDEVGVCHTTVANARRKVADFRPLEEESLRQYRAKIGAEIHRRGITGVKEPVYHLGKVVGWILKYSDRLLIEHARRHVEEYREKIKVDQTTTGTLAVGLADLKALSPESREDLRRILEREGGGEEEEE